MNETTTTTATTTQPKYKSWALWLSVLGALWVIGSAFGVPAKIGLTSDTWTAIINGVGTILIALGIVNNPTDSSKL